MLLEWPYLANSRLWAWMSMFAKRGRAGIEPATSRTQSDNHTTRPTAHSIAAKHARRDSNPQPPDSKSDALSVAPRALAPVR